MILVEIGQQPHLGPLLMLVEDNPADIKLTEKALGAVGWRGRLGVARDGRTALDFLQRRGPYRHAPRPALLLLDLNLPGLGGREVLTAVRDDPELSTLPVIVLSTSEDPGDIEDAYARRANAYVTKPIDFSRFEAVARQLTGFWLEAAQLP